MGKQNNAMVPSVWTSGAGIAIGTNIDIGGFFIGPAATTLTLKVGTDTLLAYSGGPGVIFNTPVATNGAITGTSSGGSFMVLLRTRVS